MDASGAENATATLPHAFWYHPELPESIEANHIMADFFLAHLAK